MQKCIVKSILSREKFAKSNRLCKVIRNKNAKRRKVLNLGTFLYFIYTHFILFCPILYYPIGVKLVQNFENWCKPLLRPSLCFFVSIFKTQTTRHFCVLNMPINKNQIINSNLSLLIPYKDAKPAQSDIVDTSHVVLTRIGKMVNFGGYIRFTDTVVDGTVIFYVNQLYEDSSIILIGSQSQGYGFLHYDNTSRSLLLSNTNLPAGYYYVVGYILEV